MSPPQVEQLKQYENTIAELRAQLKVEPAVRSAGASLAAILNREGQSRKHPERSGGYWSSVTS